MRKISILLIALMVVSVGFLSGCNEIDNPLQSDEDRFVGSWKEQISKWVMTIFSDGTFLGSIEGQTISGEWKIKDGKFFMTVVTVEGTPKSNAWDYSFSDDGNTLYFTDLETDITSIYIRQ